MKQNVPASLEEIEEVTRRAVDELVEHLEEIRALLEDPTLDMNLLKTRMPGKRLLDAGCGWGRLSAQLAEDDFEYVGVDLSPKMLAVARAEHPNLTFKEMSLRKLDFPDESFDGIWCCCVLQHEPKNNMLQVLSEMYRVLAPHGMLLIKLQETGELSGEYCVKIRRNTEIKTYWAFWDIDEFEAVLTEADFEVIGVNSTAEIDGSKAFLVRK
jgi:2-polyprenyl-3-methyl-5-hydroxy-6-metoxy-1,4-benzoquinol methylase